MTDPQPLCLAVNQRDPEEIRVALHRGTLLEDVRWAHGEHASMVGNIYLGVVRQVERGLDAAFIDFGQRRAGFLHLGNVHPAYADQNLTPLQVACQPSRQAQQLADEADPEIDDGVDLDEGDEAEAAPEGEPRVAVHIADLLKVEQKVLVQVMRDPVRGKGATLTTILSLAGRKVVLVPSLGRIGVSRRIQDVDERQRLRETVEGHLHESQLGGIARTASQNASAEDIHADLDHLLQTWKRIQVAIQDAEAPALLEAEAGAAARAVRELFSPELKRILVDDEQAAKDIEGILERYVPGHGLRVERYHEGRPLFEMLGIERDWQNMLKARVAIGGGASIVIHETEALTAIDVNSGRIDKGSLEETAFEANSLAATEMARQIRLRDIGGIVVADFIDMQDPEHRRELEQLMREVVQHDRARLKLGRMSSFGLLPMTRRRLGAGLPRGSAALCKGCGGSGNVSHHWGGALRLLRRLRAIDGELDWNLRVHPGVMELLDGPLASSVRELELNLQFQPDFQVPSGEPVVERLAP
ncbi:MAG: Rne/Rng family ribonuclease [Planctomycetes bacterium]|nr:Rne/Rng family ribonuclease [Planctomycetota bacterium]